MRRNLMYRVTKMISASAHALIGKIENSAPGAVMEQSLRDMAGVLDELRQELGTSIANKHLVNKKLSALNDQHEKLSEQIEDALKKEAENLASAAIATQMDIEAQIPVLEKAMADHRETEIELEGYISAIEAKKREMKDELKAFLSTKHKGSDESVSTRDSQAKADKAIAHFEDIMEKHTGLAMSGFDAKNAKSLRELEILSREHRIQERLQAIKQQTS